MGLDLRKLEDLKEKMQVEEDFGAIWKFFFDHFGENPEFMALGARAGESMRLFLEPILESICKQIGIELKNQYVLGYRPLNQSTDGKWRKIRVKINRSPGMPRLSVRSKTGYYATRTAMK